MQKNTQRNLYTQQLLHTDACPLHRAIFTHRSLYTHMLLHKASQSSFYRQTLSHSHTQMPLHTEAFTRRNQCVCTQKLLHTDAFAQRILHSRRSFYTHTPLHTESFYTQRLLHREVFTQSSFYTQELLRTEAFAQSSFMVAILSLWELEKPYATTFSQPRGHTLASPTSWWRQRFSATAFCSTSSA
jgi:hypothetical protein